MGFGMKDVDDFLERAKDVEQKINDIKSGKISVEQLEGARARRTGEGRSGGGEAKRLADIERRSVEREAEKVEEHARWWEGADVLYPIDNDEVLDDSVQNAAGETAQDMRCGSTKMTTDAGRRGRRATPRHWKSSRSWSGRRRRKKTRSSRKITRTFATILLQIKKNGKRVMPKRTRRPVGNA